MSLESKRYTKIVCVICGQDFRSLNDFSGHQNKHGKPCIGGQPE